MVIRLTFCIILNNDQVVELKPGGRDIVVTNQNRIEYIHLMADYRLNKQVCEKTENNIICSHAIQ
jgi:hypothetical protein